MCLSNQTDDHNVMVPSMGNTLKHSYLGFIAGLRHEMLEPRRGKTEFESSQTPQEPLRTACWPISKRRSMDIAGKH